MSDDNTKKVFGENAKELLHSVPRERPAGRTARIGHDVMIATLDLILGGKGHEFTFEMVAKKANVNRATLYRRWGSKSRLIAWAMLEHQKNNLPNIDSGNLEEDLVTLMLALDEQLNGVFGKWFIHFSAFESSKDASVAEAMSTFWDERFKSVSVILEKAIARKQIRADTNLKLLLEQVFGAYYFRLIRGVDEVLTKRQAQEYVKFAVSQYKP